MVLKHVLTEPKMSTKVMFHMAGDVLTECVASFMTELCTVVESPILQIDRESSPGKDTERSLICDNFM